MRPLSGFAGKLHAASFPLFLDYLFAVPYASPLLCRRAARARPQRRRWAISVGRLQLCCHLVRENQASPIGAVKAKPGPKAEGGYGNTRI